MTGMENTDQTAGNLALRPIGDKIIVRQDPYKETFGASTIVRLKGQREGYENFGTIKAIGSKAEIDANVGDRVLFRRRPNIAISPDSREGNANGWTELLCLTADDILAVVEG